MHAEAYEWLAAHTAHYHDQPIQVLELGSRNINGTPRTLPGLNRSTYLGIDLEPGPDVDLVADAATFTTAERYDLVISCEVFEHTPHWPAIIGTAHRVLTTNGVLLITAASDPRAPHSATDGGPVHPDEHYQNINWYDLNEALRHFTNRHVETHPDRGDIYARATKG